MHSPLSPRACGCEVNNCLKFLITTETAKACWGWLLSQCKAGVEVRGWRSRYIGRLGSCGAGFRGGRSPGLGSDFRVQPWGRSLDDILSLVSFLLNPKSSPGAGHSQGSPSLFVEHYGGKQQSPRELTGPGPSLVLSSRSTQCWCPPIVGAERHSGLLGWDGQPGASTGASLLLPKPF